MDYYYFVSSLEVNSANHFFHNHQNFDRSLYESPTNFDYELDVFTPNENEFSFLETLLSINQKATFTGIRYLTHVPITVKIEKKYFEHPRQPHLEFADFVNNFLTLRQYFYNDYGIPSFKLDGRKIFFKSALEYEWIENKYDYLDKVSFFEHIKESIINGEGAMDLVCALAAEKKPLELEWIFLVNAIKSFFEGDFNQAFINCCTSLEIVIASPIRKWLESFTLLSYGDEVKKLEFSIANPFKFDVFTNTINPEPFKIYDIPELRHLLTELKSLNTIRNKIAHQGHSPSIHETKSAIEATSKFLNALFVFDRKMFYDQMKKR